MMSLTHPRSARFSVLALATLTTLGLWWAQAQAADPKASPAPKAALTVSTVQPASSQLSTGLSANGTVSAWQEASVGSEAQGLRIAEVHAQVGDVVQKGQLLVTFASESVQADVALARAALAEAQANAAEALANAERARAVKDSGALSAQQVSQYLTAEASAKARVESAKAQLDAQLLRLKNTQVFAPDSGVVSARMATVGAVVGAGTELLRLIRQGRLEWRGEVTASELGRVSAGTPVLVTAPSGTQVKGRVRMVAPTVDVQTRNAMVYVDLPGAKGFKPGMYARGEFVLGQSAALTVPQSAVVVRDGFSYVYRVGADNRVAQVKVSTGRIAQDQVEVLSGVKAGEVLVASGGSFLSDGDTVRVVGAGNAAASK